MARLPLAGQDMAVMKYMIQGSGHAEGASCHDIWFAFVPDDYVAQFVDFSELEPEEAADTGT